VPSNVFKEKAEEIIKEMEAGLVISRQGG